MNGRCVFGAQYKQEDKEIMLYEEKVIETIPVGPLGLIPLKSCTELGNKVDRYLVDWRRERESEHKSTIAFTGEILILSMHLPPALVPAKERELLRNP